MRKFRHAVLDSIKRGEPKWQRFIGLFKGDSHNNAVVLSHRRTILLLQWQLFTH
jgi:hypothetical protein